MTLWKDQIVQLLANDYRSVGVEILSVSNTAVGLASIPDDATYALIQTDTAPIRYWIGSTPTSTEGMYRDVYDAFDVVGRNDLLKLRAIRTTASDGKLMVQYYKKV